MEESNVEKVQVEEVMEVDDSAQIEEVVDDSAEIEEVVDDLEEGEVSESDDEVSIIRLVPNTQAEKMNSRCALISLKYVVPLVETSFSDHLLWSIFHLTQS